MKKIFVDGIGQTHNDIVSVLDGSIAIENVNVEEFIEGSQEVLEAVETGWEEIQAQLEE